jgi:hypothetical protein
MFWCHATVLDVQAWMIFGSCSLFGRDIHTFPVKIYRTFAYSRIVSEMTFFYYFLRSKPFSFLELHILLFTNWRFLG